MSYAPPGRANGQIPDETWWNDLQGAVDAIDDAVALLQQAAVNVRAKGAVGDGVTNDSQAINAAITEVHAAGGGVAFLPPGSYAVGSTITPKGVLTLRGAGMHLTTIKGTASGVPANFFVNGSTRTRLTVEDLTLSLAGAAQSAVNLSGNFGLIDSVTFRRVRFTCTADALYGALITRVNDVTFEDCEFTPDPRYRMIGVQVGEGFRRFRFRRNKAIGCVSGLLLDTGNATGYPTEIELAEDIEISGNHFDGLWWLLPYVRTAEGGPVTYTGTTLTDTGVDFSSLGLFVTAGTAQQNIRAMPVLRSGTLTTADAASVIDTGATFIAAGVRIGHIIRTASAMAFVSGIESETVLRIEGWIDPTTYQPVANPAVGTAYTVYAVYLGEVTSVSGSTITTPRWWDIDGNTVTPPAGTRYEIMVKRLNYSGFNAEYGAQRAVVHGNTFMRCWSDQCSVFGGRWIVTGNQIRDGQDMGITHNGDWSVIAHNIIERQGASAIFHSGSNTIIDANELIGATPWENATTDVLPVGILIEASASNAASNNVVTGNIIDGISKAASRFGITLRNLGAGNDKNRVEGNTFLRLATACINVAGGVVSNGRWYNNDYGTMTPYALNGGGTVTNLDMGVLSGTGTPEGVVTAPVGTMYRRLNGGVGTTQYTKESGTGATGWVAK